MLRVDRLCIYTLMFGLIFMIPSVTYLTMVDELMALAFVFIAVVDSIFSGSWRRYSFLWLVIGIITFYAYYSLYVVHFNHATAIFVDWVIEIKPFAPFAVMFAVAPTFTDRDKNHIKKICYFNCLAMSISLFCGWNVVEALVYHVTYAGNILFICSLFILFCSMDKNGQVDKRTITHVVIFLTIGLVCGRSKYFGIYVLTLYFLFLYKPGMMRHFQFKHVLIVGLVVFSTIAVAWQKIDYYFISGNGTGYDPQIAETFTRPVLYFTGFSILSDFFPFGTGLASFATAASGQYYSDVYYYYGINHVHGLSPKLDWGFFCDAFYPSLAQFGVVGVFLFTWFWIHFYKYVKILIRSNPYKYKYPFIIVAVIISFIFIESVAATTFTHTMGATAMCFFGLISGMGHIVYKQQQLQTKELSLINKTI